jgi:hypothetical protein
MPAALAAFFHDALSPFRIFKRKDTDWTNAAFLTGRPRFGLLSLMQKKIYPKKAKSKSRK